MYLVESQISPIVTSNYTIQSGEYLIRFDSSGGSFDITLPDPSIPRKLLLIDVAGQASNGITVKRYTNESIGGQYIDLLLNQNWGTQSGLELVSDGTNWWMIGFLP